MLKRLCIATSVFLVAAFAVAKDFPPPPPKPAATYALHEAHTNEHLTIAAELYDTPEKLSGAKVDYVGHELLPIRLILTNEGDTPIALTDLRIEFITAAKDKIPPATMDDLMRRIARPDKNPDRTTRNNPLPIPKFGKKPERVKADQRDEMENLLFRAKAVEAHSTQSGFLFFDVQGLSTPLSRARLYLTGMSDSAGKELLYFEISLDK